MAGDSPKIKYGSKKFNEMLDELCKEAAELSLDYNCKVGIFVAPKKIDENPTMGAFCAPSVKSFVDEMKAKAKAEKRKNKKLMAKIKKKAKLNAEPICGCKLAGA